MSTTELPTLSPTSPVRFRQDNRRFSIDLFDAVVLVAFAGMSVWLLVVLALKSTPDHVWIGTAGPNAGDQMQYLGWIEESAHHFLIGNPFTTGPSRVSFLQPGLAISGLLVRLGMTSALSYLVWLPVAVWALFFAVRGYIRRLLPGTAARRFALVIALFYVSPAAEVASTVLKWLPADARYFLQPVVTEMWPASYVWGYEFTAISVACFMLALLSYERDRDAGRLRPSAPVLALICAWFQPWQGATVIGVVLAVELLQWLTGRSNGWRLPAATIIAAAVPLAYYASLDRIDPTWALADKIDFFVVPFLSIVAALIPLGAPALLAYGRRPESFQDFAVRVWPLVALGLYGFITLTHIGTYPLHALQGLSVPLAVLAVTGVVGLNIRARSATKVVLGAAAVGLLVVPSGIQNLNLTRSVGDTVYGPDPIFVTSGEWSALQYLKESPVPGGVLSPVYLGQTVPGLTGRTTWVGNISWTPDYVARTEQANALFTGTLSEQKATALIRSSDARFLLSDCYHHADLARLLPSTVALVEHFGCATIYRVRAGQ